MKRKKQILSVALLTAMVFTNILVSRSDVSAANIGVMLDGRRVQFDVPPANMSDRILVPFRKIGEDMGANVEWDKTTKKITMTLQGDFVELQVGSNVMTRGQMRGDADGRLQITNKKTVALDAPPVIVNDRTLVPVRAISEGLGATVTYDKNTSTVMITSGTRATAAPTPKPATPKPTVSPEFADTTYYQEISAKRAEDMYELNGSRDFVLLYFNSGDASAAGDVKEVKYAAEAANFKVYGVDTNSSRFANPENLKFIFNVVSEGSATPPILFFNKVEAVNKKVEYITDLSNRETIAEKIKRFTSGAEVNPSASPSPSPTATATATPTPTPSSGTSYQNYWHSMSKSEAEIKYQNNEKFILVYYNNKKSGYEEKLNIIKDAVAEAKISVYYADFDPADTGSWFAQDILGTSYNPMILYISGYQMLDYDASLSNATDIANRITSFGNTY